MTHVSCHLATIVSTFHVGCMTNFILALKVILLDRLQGINCSGIQEP